MRKNLFWIYLLLSEIDILVFGVLLFNSIWWYATSITLITLMMFLIFEFFLTVSFFIDELNQKRKVMLWIFLFNLFFMIACRLLYS